MKIIFFFLGFSGWTAALTGQISGLADYVIKWENGLKYTEDIFNLMPDSLWTFKPVEEEMSFRKQILHISQNMYWLSSSYLKGENLSLDIKDTNQSVSEIKRQFQEIGTYTLSVLRNLSENDLEAKVSFFAGNFSRWQIVHLLHDHHTHHRGQLIVYLRLNGIKPPKYVGW
jgi:uncharacterized damage-inducible protein DinB